MDIGAIFKLLVSICTDVAESKYRSVVIGCMLLAVVWAGMLFASGSKCDMPVEKRVTILETKIDGISASLDRIERSEIENRRDLSELKNVLISK